MYSSLYVVVCKCNIQIGNYIINLPSLSWWEVLLLIIDNRVTRELVNTIHERIIQSTNKNIHNIGA